MSDFIKLKQGLNINLIGKAEKVFYESERPVYVALKPGDFVGLTPRLSVNPGDRVNVGDQLFHDKYHPEIKFTSPVSGVISEILRGERRIIKEVIIKTAEKDEFLEFKVNDPVNMSREDIISVLLDSGMWPVIRQRPYSIIARPADKPKAIFISGFDTAPLAPDLDFIAKGNDSEFKKGIDVLFSLTDGHIHLSLDARNPVNKIYSDIKNIKVHKFKGPHPAGNVGVQIHHIDPINKGEIVWYISIRDVIRIGKLFINGKIDNTTAVALTGSEVKTPQYYKTIIGAYVSSIVEGNLNHSDIRIISGNVLTGKKVEKNGFLGFYDQQVTVIPEGKFHEFLGWASPGFGKYSFHRSFWSWLRPDAEYRIDTNLHGGKRAFVFSGIYEKVIPMNIYPLQLLKAILIEDIDMMEKLGIYEVDEEDFALAEFICPSKTEIQTIIRKGLELIRKETE